MSSTNDTNELGAEASLEVIAPTVDEAIGKGLSDLGLGKDDVKVEVLDEGSRGLLGIGSRQARVRLTIKSQLQQKKEITQEYKEIVEDIVESTDKIETADDGLLSAEELSTEEVTIEKELAEELPQDDIAMHVARETVLDLLETMHVDAEVDVYYAEPDDAHSRSALWVDVRGEDLSILIGQRAETLNALQYITSLILGKELGRSVPLVVDVQGYRKRRSQEVIRVARQMADQAVKSGRRQYLEPMPASERRLVHIELRKNPDVKTESVGEDPRRKVTIIPIDQEDS